MAFSFFGKKDKNPPEAAAPAAKAPPTPPKIQNPPTAGSIPAVKPPQPSGLIPTSGMPSGAATTQPMVMPRGGAGLKPTRPGVVQSTRSTQRIVLPGGLAAGGKATGTKSLSNPAAAPQAGRVNLPVGMILRCLPAEVLAGSLADFEAAGTAATEIGLPMNMILSQLPSGKVEMTLADLVPHFPPGYLQPTAAITNYLPTVVSLPLMDVVMRIPPDLLALRPDQKGVDASVINMADPFTEEILREQAEAARRQQPQTNIIDESQVQKAEEFVPQQATTTKTIAPPPRPMATGMNAPNVKSGQLPMPPTTPARLPGSVGAPSAAPSISARTISPSGSLAVPTRATTAIPARAQGSITSQLQTPPPMTPQPTAPIPQAPTLPRPMAPMSGAPVPPTPRQTTSLPMPPPPTQPAMPRMAPPAPVAPVFTPPPVVAAAPPAPVAPPEPEPVEAPSEEPTAIVAGQADPAADDLQRLAALAMAQMGESEEPEAAATDLLAPTQDAPVPAGFESQALTAPTAPLPPASTPEPPVATPPPPAPVPVVAAAVPAPVTTAIPAVKASGFSFTPPAPLPVAPPPVAATPPAPLPTPIPAPAPIINSTPVAAPKPFPAVAPKAVEPSAPVAAAAPAPTPVAPPAPPAPTPETPEESEAFNLNTCTVDQLMQIPGCFKELAESIVRHRGVIGSFQKIEDLLDVPGITKAAYTSLTGEAPPPNRIPLTLNELLGFPSEHHASLKDVTDRICCWPDITGCVLSQGSGLSLVGTTPPGVEKAALVAFVPKMFDSLNKSFSEVAGKETNDIVIPTAGTSFHILRDNDLYLIILSRLPQMPERHLKVARFVLAALAMRRD